MKKSYLLLAIPALMLASCSTDDTVDAPAAPGINFNVAINGSSRATATTTATISDFRVTALSDEIGNNLCYFNKILVTRDGNAWKSKGEYMWPSFARLKFSAYSPSTADLSMAYNRTGLRTIIQYFKVKATAAEQEDLLVAQNSMENQYNLHGVGLYFSHALSQIKLRAYCTNPNMKVEVYGTMLGYLNSKGSFKYPDNDNNNILDLSKEDASLWYNLSTPTDLVSTLSSPVTIQGADYSTSNTPAKVTGDDIMGSDNSFMVIPQHLSERGAWTATSLADGAYIAVKCKIYLRKSGDDFSTLYWPSDASMTEGDYICVPLRADLDPSRSYTILLDLAGAGFKKPKPEPQPEPKPEPIIKGDIKFSVTVRPWQDGNVESIDMPTKE